MLDSHTVGKGLSRPCWSLTPRTPFPPGAGSPPSSRQTSLGSHKAVASSTGSGAEARPRGTTHPSVSSPRPHNLALTPPPEPPDLSPEAFLPPSTITKAAATHLPTSGSFTTDVRLSAKAWAPVSPYQWLPGSWSLLFGDSTLGHPNPERLPMLRDRPSLAPLPR